MTRGCLTTRSSGELALLAPAAERERYTNRGRGSM